MTAKEYRIKELLDMGNNEAISKRIVDTHNEFMKIKFAEEYLEYKLNELGLS